jgi:hypothetical protein
MSSDLDHDLEEALREFAAQPAPGQPAQSPPPIDRQPVQYPWPPPAIETQKTRLSSQPPPVPPDAIGEHLKTVVFATSPAVAVAIEGGIKAAQQLNALQRRFAELETTLKRMVRDIRALKDHLLQLEPHAARAPRLKALIATSLRTCDLALAAAGER